MKKARFLLLILLLTIIINPIKTKANSFETFGEELEYLEELKAEKRRQENETAITQAEYDKTVTEIYNINMDIEKLNKEIKEAEEQILEYEAEIIEKKKETDNILVFLQLSNGEKAYLEYIFEAKTFTDFIHRISIVEQISKYNKELIKEMNDLIKQNNDLKKKNAENIVKQENNRKELKTKLASLGSRIEELDGEGADITEQIKAQEEWIAQLREMGCTKNNDKLATCMGMPTSTGFVRPLTAGTVTSEYYWRISPITGKPETHSGIDLGVNEGTPIYPVAAGRVGAKIYRSSCGGNMIYIYHMVNGQKVTSVYMHLLNFNEDYQVGDVVRLTDVIGYTGGRTTGSYRGGYDDCTFGAHLHLTLATGHTTAHRATMFNPRDVINFPAIGYYWNSRTW